MSRSTAELQDIGALARPGSPNSALAAPRGFHLPPDLVTPDYQPEPRELFATMGRVALTQPRTSLRGVFEPESQAHYVIRSAVFGFPDLVLVQALPGAAGGSGLVLYSRSVHGRYDFGVNLARLKRWLAALDAEIPPGKDR